MAAQSAKRALAHFAELPPMLYGCLELAERRA
jgi:hypothetical protein